MPPLLLYLLPLPLLLVVLVALEKKLPLLLLMLLLLLLRMCAITLQTKHRQVALRYVCAVWRLCAFRVVLKAGQRWMLEDVVHIRQPS